MLPSATHVESVPFLLVRESSIPPPPAEDDPETLPDVAKAVRARLPPPRANVVAEDLPTVIIDEPPLLPRMHAQQLQSEIPTVVLDAASLGPRDLPTLVLELEGRQVAEPPRKRRAMRMLVAGVMTLGALGALGGSLHAFDMHRLHGAIPRSVASMFHR